ncbi:MAG: PqqD family protein [Clostridiales bacterium]|nr:PqqD family protein [Clostridiales bacterium]
MKVNRDLILREIAGDYVLVPVGSTMNAYTGLFSVSEVGARIWQLLPDAESKDHIVNILLTEYDVEKAELERDVSLFLGELKKFGMIES